MHCTDRIMQAYLSTFLSLKIRLVNVLPQISGINRTTDLFYPLSAPKNRFRYARYSPTQIKEERIEPAGGAHPMGYRLSGNSREAR